MNSDDQIRKDAIDNVAANLEEWRKGVDVRFDTVEAALALNTTATNTIKTNTDEVVDLLNSFKGAMRVLEMLGKLAKPLTYITGLVSGVVGLWYFFWPKK